MMCRLLLVAFVVLAVRPAAHGDNQTVLGSVLAIENPGTADKRTITAKAKETASDDTLVGNPVASGATVAITANGTVPSNETYELLAGRSPTTSKPFWTGDAVKGFTYRDPKGENGPVKSARIKSEGGVFQIKIGVDGKLAPVSVVPPNPGSDGCVVFTVTGGDSYSVQFASGRVTNRGAALFRVAKPTREGPCVSTTTTTTTTSTTTTTACAPGSACCLTTEECPEGHLCVENACQPAFPYVPPPGATPLRYRDLVFGGVATTPDVTYGSAVNMSGQTITLKLDVYEPVGDAVMQRPAIVWVHGGSFCCGDKTSAELVDEATIFARKGYLNVSINYRLEPGGCSASSPTISCITAIQEAMQDAQTAVRFLRTNAATFGIDASRIAIGGSSAGAITALHVGFRSAEDATAAVGGAVSLSGANILAAIGPGDAPSLLFHGTADPLVPYQWAVNTVNQATAAGLDAFLTTWNGAGHVPYVQHRSEILDQTTNFLYWELDLAHAEQ